MAQERVKPLILRSYLAVTRWAPSLLWRQAKAAHLRLGCDPRRLTERKGHPVLPRPTGPLIWIHAASVGELVSIIDLAMDIQTSTGAALLVTTMTETSASLAAKRLPKGAIHQFMPVDTPAAVTGFLDHWRPDLACFVESDLWPRLILSLRARAIPLALINARPSSSREKAPKTMGYLLHQFDRITVQDRATQDQIERLGIAADRISMTGDLKSAAAPLSCDATALSRLAQQIAKRPLWLAASTHSGEEEQVLDAHVQARSRIAGLLLILVPRHPERGDEIAKILETRDISFARRSLGETVNNRTQVYLADTLGEMGLFFTLAPLTFMGASFGDQGGHNPFEPAQLGTAILHGPRVKNFAADYALLDHEGAAKEVSDPTELAHEIIDLIGSNKLDDMQHAGLCLMATRMGIRQAVMDHLRPILPSAKKTK